MSQILVRRNSSFAAALATECFRWTATNLIRTPGTDGA